MIRTNKQKKKESFDDEMDITPMIDVVLLLLIFFMVSARMAPGAMRNLPKAKQGVFASLHDSVVLTVKGGGTGTPTVAALDGRIFSTDPEEQSAEIAEFVVESLQNFDKRSVIVQAEANVLTSDMVRIQSAIGSVLDVDQEILIAVEH